MCVMLVMFVTETLKIFERYQRHRFAALLHCCVCVCVRYWYHVCCGTSFSQPVQWFDMFAFAAGIDAVHGLASPRQLCQHIGTQSTFTTKWTLIRILRIYVINIFQEYATYLYILLTSALSAWHDAIWFLCNLYVRFFAVPMQTWQHFFDYSRPVFHGHSSSWLLSRYPCCSKHFSELVGADFRFL